MDAEERHWTEDADLIERFVLNKVDPAERNELEDHLRICEVCKQAVRAEQLLLAGIRRSGRERFKAELAKKLRAADDSRVPWPHILSAAAVVVIILSVAFYNRWFEIIKEPEIEEVVQLPEGADTKQTKQEPSLEPAQPELQEKSSSFAGEMQRQAPLPRSKRGERHDGLAEGTSHEAMRDERAAAGAGVAHVPMVEADQAQPEAAALSSTQEEEIWLEGKIVATDSDLLNAPAEQSTPQLFKAERKDAHRRISGAERTPPTDEVTFVLRQQSLSALPASRRKAKPHEQTSTITASIRRSGDTTIVTLYLDTLMEASTLGRAAVEMPAADSLIVSLDDRRIVYRLIEGWGEKLRQAK